MDTSKFVGVKWVSSAQILLENLSNDLFICYEIKYLFKVKQTFQKYTQVFETYRNMDTLTYPMGEEW